MLKFLKKPTVLAALAAAVLLGSTTRASANIEIDFSIDGGARFVGAASAGSTAIFSGTVGGLFDVVLTLGTTNSPGTPGLAFETQGNNIITTLYGGGSANQHTLHVYVSSTDFTNPTSPPPTILHNTSSISELTGATSVTFTSYASTTNTLFATSGGTTASTGYSYDVSGPQSSGGQGSSSTMFSPNGSKYSLTNIGDYKMDGGTSVTIVGGNTSVTPTPVPSGVVMALTGLPVLGLGLWMRRRQLSPMPAVS